MEIKELRIGNWVNNGIQSGHFYQLTEEMFLLILTNKFYLEKAQGIALTEEWLIKFGFTLVSVPSAYGYDCNKVFDGGVFRGAFSKFNNPNGFYYLGFLINGAYKKIEYVHQLQNLFFALTGIELTIKEPIK